MTPKVNVALPSADQLMTVPTETCSGTRKCKKNTVQPQELFFFLKLEGSHSLSSTKKYPKTYMKFPLKTSELWACWLHSTGKSQMLFTALGKINRITFSSFISLNRFSFSIWNPTQASHLSLFCLYLQLASASFFLVLTAAVWNAHGMQWILCHSCVLPQGGTAANKVLPPTPELHY